MGQHDSSYRLLFSYPYLVECLLRGFVPGDWLDRLDFESLETVSEAHPRDDIGVRYDDMIWRLRWRDLGVWIYIYLMLEFQSEDEPFMAVRVLDYEGGLYRQIVRALPVRRGDRLPIVLPVVIYRGQPAWRSSTEVFDLISQAPAEVEAYLPHLRYLLLDANSYPSDELEALHNPFACILWLEGSRHLETAAIDELDRLLKAPGHAGLRRVITLWLTQVFLPSRMPGVTVPEVKKLEEVSPMIAENSIDWSTQWREEGKAEGRREGKAEGRREGEAELLVRLMARRFGRVPSTIEQRVRDADPEQLLSWGERLLSANALAEVFNGHCQT